VNLALLAGPVGAPILFWAGYHYHKDRHLPEPLGHLFLAMILGVGSYFLGLLMYRALGLVGLRFDAFVLAENNPAGLFLYAIGVIGLIEELAKMAPFLLVVVRFREFDEPIDGIIYGSFIALGFAAVENWRYLPFLTGWEGLARGFAGPVVHMVFASIWSWWIGRALLAGKQLLPVVLGALAFTALLHGIYDFIVIALPSLLPVSAALILGIWMWRLQLIRRLHGLPPGPCP